MCHIIQNAKFAHFCLINSHITHSSIRISWPFQIDKCWQRRNLSLYGKILICKTFLLSQISYTIQALVPPVKIINAIDLLLFKFIWQKKHSNKKAFEKIKRKVICQPIEKGGLGMISIKSQTKLFHLKWIKNAIEFKATNEKEHGMTDCIFKGLGGFNYFLSFSSRLEETDLPQNMTRFWKSVVITWSAFKYNEEAAETDNLENLLSQSLFFNKNISYKGKQLFFHKWVRSDVKYVFQFMEQGRWSSKSEVEEKINRYPNLHFEYYALINGIPSRWKDVITSQAEGLSSHHNINILDVMRSNLSKSLKLLDHSNNILRQKLEGENSEICGRNFWKRKNNYDINPNFKMAKLATKESRLRLLHFKILHNIYPSNILLKKMGIKDSDLCEFCNERDIIEHMFINCKLLNGFWADVFQTIYIHTNERFPQTENDILFGYNYESVKVGKDKINTANHILLIAKLSISKFRYGKTKNISLIFESEMNIRNKYFY